MYRDANREGWPHDGTVRTPDQVLLTDAVQNAGGLCHRGAACGHQGFQIQPPAGADTQPLGRGLAQPGAVGWSAQKLGHVAGGRGGHCRHSGCCVAVALMAAHAPSTQEPVCLLSPPVSDGPKVETFHTSVAGGRVMQWVGGAQRAVAVRRAQTWLHTAAWGLAAPGWAEGEEQTPSCHVCVQAVPTGDRTAGSLGTDGPVGQRAAGSWASVRGLGPVTWA